MVIFKLNAFPNISETFIVSNLIYTIKKGYNIRVYVKRYLGIKNSSQQQLLEINNVERYVKKSIYQIPYYLKLILLLKGLFNRNIIQTSVENNLFTSKKGLLKLVNISLHDFLFKPFVCHVHFNDTLLEFIDFNISKFIKTKFIVTFHGYDAFTETKESFKKKYGDFYDKHVAYVTVNSLYLKNKVLALGVEASKIKVIPIGIDNSFFKGQIKSLPKQKIKLLSVGRLIQLKGHIYGIYAINELKQLGYNIEYSIVGKGEELDFLQAEINRLDLKNEVKLLGGKSQVEIREIMKSHHVFLMTSTVDDKTNREEAFGVVSIEAQAMGLPVVGFRCGGFIETIVEQDTGFLVKDRDSLGISNVVAELIAQPEKYKKHSKSCIAHAVKFDYSNTTTKYIELYKSLL